MKEIFEKWNKDGNAFFAKTDRDFDLEIALTFFGIPTNTKKDNGTRDK